MSQHVHENTQLCLHTWACLLPWYYTYYVNIGQFTCHLYSARENKIILTIQSLAYPAL